MERPKTVLPFFLSLCLKILRMLTEEDVSLT